MIVIQKVERVLVVSEDKVVAHQSKVAASAETPTSHLKDRKVARLELALNLN